MKRILLLLFSLSLLSACEEEHFITDPLYRKMVKNDFQTRKVILGHTPENIYAVFDSTMTLREREALQFLYAYSPLVDLSLSGGNFLLENVRLAFQAQEEMPWGQEVPENIFRHFVLPVRGGKENLDTARKVFYGELKERVSACSSMEEAALEVNHWCHERVIYKPTNARTSSPLATVSRGYGRCGEESIFTLAALRAVGIPARQIYTPRWAHCDDNHAWIEVWADGIWKYLGACEPEPKLNIAWFTVPVQQAMYVEADVFGKYEGDEELVFMNATNSGVNVTSHYTETKRTKVQVVDRENHPVEGAKVEYKIFNYGEYYPVVTLYTDRQGETSLTLGLGDLIVWAEKDGKFGFAEFTVAEKNRIIITLDKEPGDEFVANFEIVPPKQSVIEALVSDEERAVNDYRFLQEDSIRNASVSTFMRAERARDMAEELGVDADRFASYLVAARGNQAEIVRFIKEMSVDKRNIAMDLLSVVAEKDLQDTPSEVFSSHVIAADAYARRDFFNEYILNPRVQNELITAYRDPLLKYVSEKGIKSVPGLIREMEDIRVVDSVYSSKVVMPPVAVLPIMNTDARSKGIFFVAVCRTMGYAARLNPVSAKPEYYDGTGWISVSFDQDTIVPKGKLMVKYAGNEVSDPKYFLNFTVGKIENGSIRTIDLGSNASVDMGVGAAYQTIFSGPVELEQGDYLLATGNRRNDGAVLAGITSFRVLPGEVTQVNMQIQPCIEEVEVLGNVGTELTFVPELGGKPKAIELPVRGYTVVALVEANKEPTNHLLRDMSGMKDEFEQLDTKMYFVFKDQENSKKFSRADFRPFPATSFLGYDQEGKLAKRFTEDLRQLETTDNLPVILLLNAKGEVVFLSQGYRIGLGTQIMKVMSKK